MTVTTSTRAVLDPLQATRRIADSYRRYLLASFGPRHRVFGPQFEQAVSGGIDLTNGPFLQATAPFEPGQTIRQLIDEGVLDPAFARLDEPLPIGRPLHLHQEQAIRKATIGSRNLVVSTGTGSGKTETFLIPILQQLFTELRQGTLAEPGVRALLLYPMNALANDQLKRLRRLLADAPEITFGRYTGETKNGRRQALDHFRDNFPEEPELVNELFSREEMQERPPHLLLTNFAMLEYLLLRPRDHRLFDGETGRHWRFLVLDEAHVYDGAKGAEVAMLLRRVRERVLQSERGRLRCFATSATLGRGRQDHPKLTEFAWKLFDEPFAWDDDDPERQDVVTATRRPLVQSAGVYRLPDEAIAELCRSHRDGADADTLARIASRAEPVTPVAAPGDTAAAYLHRLLRDDERLVELQRVLSSGPRPLHELAAQLFGGPAGLRTATDLVELAVAARERSDDTPLLPARYHFFVRALEGAFVCLRQDHDDREPRLRLQRHLTCPACSRVSRASLMFELGICRHCRAPHLIGRVETNDDGQHLRPWRVKDSDENRRRDLFLLDAAVLDDDEDEEASETDVDGDQYAVLVCPGCGSLAEQGRPACRCADRPTPFEAIRLRPAKTNKDGRITTCRACRARDRNEPVGPILTGTDAPVAVVATDLYQEIPPSTDQRARYLVGEGRKLLTFSDSRQDAAFFAPYLGQSYGRAIQRRLIAQAVDELARNGDNPRPEEVRDRVLKLAEDALVLDPDASRIAKRNQVAAWLTEELLGIGRRNSLEGAGVLEIAYALPRAWQPPEALLRLGFTPAEAVDLVQLLLASLRHGGALSALEGVDLSDERFAPRNREIGLRRDTPGAGVISWLPGRNGNRRFDLVTNVLAEKRSSVSPTAVLEGLWKAVAEPNGGSKPLLATFNLRSQGRLARLDSEQFELIPLSEHHRPFRCTTCGQLTWRTIAGICPTRGCDGRVEFIADLEALRTEHYHRLHRELAPIGMEVQEHTAQWTAEQAATIQDAFVRGEVNTLSCSTTFELGVDVGDIQAVMLRNMPPTPANYVQRAGRAGRRTDAAALVVTYVQRRNHDRAYFRNPNPMIVGIIEPPVIELENPYIVRRHAHSLAFAAFERSHFEQTGEEHRNVADFFLPVAGRQDTGADAFLSWLQSRPTSVGDALRRIVPPSIADGLGLDDWTWVQALVEESETEPTWGWLTRATAVRDEIQRLDDLIDEAARDKDADKLKRYQGMRRYVAEGRRLIDFLAGRNVLPKYGFPVDVVELDVKTPGNALSTRIELQRDLQIAISEYAPGNQVVAAKYLWESRGLARRAEKEWPQYKWCVCATCGRYRQDPADLGACKVCGDVAPGPRAGSVIEPVYGFKGAMVGPAGDARPLRRNTVDRYYEEQQINGSEVHEPVTGLAPTAGVTRRRSRQGQIIIVNRGPSARGFAICHWCGHTFPGVDAPRPKKKGDPPRPHPDLRRSGRQCNGTLRSAHLGHRFLTDVVEIRLSVPMSDAASLSTLHALLESVTAVGVTRDDIDGTLHRYELHAPQAFVLYDTVPGGAGHALRLADELPALFEAALRRVSSCECGPETSCYACLRSYSNQYDHEVLSRGAAMEVLRRLVRPQANDPVLDEILDTRAASLVRAALERGGSVPLVGQYLGPSQEYLVEVLWPAERVALVVGSDARRDAWLAGDNWTVLASENATDDELQSMLHRSNPTAGECR